MFGQAVRAFAQAAAFIVLPLFLGAGTLAWTAGWVFVATYYGELSGFYRSVWMPKVGNRAAPEVGLEHANLPLTGRRSTARRATALGASRAVPTRTKDREISEH